MPLFVFQLIKVCRILGLLSERNVRLLFIVKANLSIAGALGVKAIGCPVQLDGFLFEGSPKAFG